MKKLFDLRQLEAFSAVISTGSVTGAAKMIGRSQPVVTRLIQELEADLGFDLFSRHGRRVTPTQLGTSFYREVERLLGDAERTRQRAEDLVSGQIQSIEIAATSSMASCVVPKALKILQNQSMLPLSIRVHTLGPEDVIQLVAARAADIGIASLPLDHPALDVKWIAEAHCVCVLAETHPLAAGQVVALADLRGEDLITLANPYRVLSRISAAIEQQGAKPGRMIRSNSSLSAIQMAREGLGVALLEPHTAMSLPLPGVVVRPLDVPIPYLWGIVVPQGMPESPVLPSLVEAMIKVGGENLPGFRERDVRDIEQILKSVELYD